MSKLFKCMLPALAVALFAMGGSPTKAQEIVVGSKDFTEQLILAEITAEYLTANGYDVDKRTGMGSTVLRRAQMSGQVDLYWEYVGTSLIVYNKVEGGAEMSPDEAYQTVKDLDAEEGLVWLEPTDANNTYALAMRSAEAEEQGIQSIGDLVTAVKDGEELSLAVNAEFAGRPDGLPGLQEAYGFDYPRPLVERMQSGLTYTALKEGEVDVALVFATDGRIAAFDFMTLKDNKNFFPSYALTPVVRQETLDAHPELREQMNKLSATLDTETMQRLNKQVDVDKMSVEEVAASFLEQQGMV